MPALDAGLQAARHVVAQVVEAELVVRPVGDVGGVGLAPVDDPQLVDVLLGGLALRVVDEGLAAVLRPGRLLQHAHAQPQQVEDRPHPAGVAPRQVVVDRHQVDAAAAPGRSGTSAAWRRASCLRRCASRRSCPRAAPCRRSAARRSGAGRSCAPRPRAPTAKASTSRSSSALAARQPGAELGRLGLQRLRPRAPAAPARAH